MGLARAGWRGDGSSDAEHVGGFGLGSVAGVGGLERNASTKIHRRLSVQAANLDEKGLRPASEAASQLNGGQVGAIEDGILEEFYENLRKDGSLPPSLVTGIASLFSDGKSPKPDAVVALVTTALEAEL